MEGFAEIAATGVPVSMQVVVWAPGKRSVATLFGTSALHREREMAKTVVYETGVHPEEWRLVCPSCSGVIGPDLECVQAEPIIAKWASAGRPVLENPAASAAFRSAPSITDLPQWIKRSEPSHLELAYLGQQLWPNIGEMLEALTTA